MTAISENTAPNEMTEATPESTEVKTDSTEVKTDSTEVKTDSTEAKTDSTEAKTESTEVKIHSTEANTEVKTDSTETKTDSTVDTSAVEVNPAVAKKVVKQLEYYFGDRNLPQDRFMLREVTVDNGWISLDTMLNFKRLARLVSSDKAKIAKSIETVKSELIVLSEDKNKIRRNPDKPLQQITEEVKSVNNLKTVYVKGVPLDTTIDKAEEFFTRFGQTTYIKMRKNMEGKFKGSVFVEFVDKSDADKFVEQKDLKFKEDSAEPLIIFSRNDYFKSKNQNEKSARNEKRESQLGAPQEPKPDPEPEYEHDRVIKIAGLAEVDTSREDMKELFGQTDWVDFKRGDPVAYVRFRSSAKESLEKAMKDGKFVLSGKELEPVVLEGDEEKAFWVKSIREKMEFFNKKSKKRQHGGGGRGRGGRFNKRSRTD